MKCLQNLPSKYVVADGLKVKKGKILLQRNAGDGDPTLGEASVFLTMVSRRKLGNSTSISTGIPFKKFISDVQL